jgi:putative ABC transport system permease protein
MRRSVRGGALRTSPAFFIADLAGAIRQAVRRPGQMAMPFAVIALGIAATTATFAIVDAVALRPLAHEEPDRLVMVGQTVPSLGDARVPMAWPNYIDLRTMEGTGLSEMAAFRWPGPLRVSTGGSPEIHAVSSVSGGLFDLLGNRAVLGRAIDESDDSAGARVAVIGHALWQSRFGGDRSVLGRVLTVEGQPYEIVGVMGDDFAFPVPAADLFIPLRRVPAMDDRDTRFMGVVGRIEPGLDLEAAKARMEAAMAVLVREWPENAGNGIRLDPLRVVVLGDAEPVMLVLLGAVVLLLLLSCASVANLLLARLSVRAPELAMRRALGAGRRRLVSQLLGESLVLVVAGGAVGLVLAAGATNLLRGFVPSSLPRASSIGFDIRTFAFAAAATIGCGVLFGLGPALRGSSAAAGSVLRRVTGGVVGRTGQGVLRALVAGQVAITVVLLVGAGLFVNSFARLITVEDGLDTSGVVTLRVALTAEYDDARRVDLFFEELVSRSAALPGVTAAGATWALPFTPDWASGRITVEGDPRPHGEELLLGLIPVRGRYFEAIGMRLAEGRVFEPADYTRARAALTGAGAGPAEGIVVINQAAARALWPGAASVVGKRLRRGRADEEAPWLTVVGVVRDAKRHGLDAVTEPEMYQMHPQALWASDMSLVARSDADPLALVPALTGIVRQLDASLAVTQVGRLDDFVHGSVAEPRFRTLVVAAFGIASLILALAGVYGVLSFAVSRRSREIGVRMALGAGRGRVLRDVMRDGSTPIVAGLALGLLGAAAGVGALRSQLFGIGAFDPATWLAIVLIVTFTGGAACWVPARRASRVPPSIAMRE